MLPGPRDHAWPVANKVLIVASGPSVTALTVGELARVNATVIAVNGAIDWLKRADYFFTLDPSPDNIRRMQHPRPNVEYVIACRPTVPVPKHVTWMERVHGRYYGPKVRAPGGLAKEPHRINTGNSCFGALGLAYHMKPRKVAILGLDGSNEQRVEGGHSGDLSHLHALFSSAARQLQLWGVKVVNGSPKSTVKCFDRMTPSEAVKWLEKNE